MVIQVSYVYHANMCHRIKPWYGNHYAQFLPSSPQPAGRPEKMMEFSFDQPPTHPQLRLQDFSKVLVTLKLSGGYLLWTDVTLIQHDALPWKGLAQLQPLQRV